MMAGGVREATYLNEVLAFGFGDEGLEFGSCERVHEACFGHDKEKDLGTGEDGELVGLQGGDESVISEATGNEMASATF